MKLANVEINGVQYSGVPAVRIPDDQGGAAYFYDTSDATASAGDILSGKAAYNASGSVSGSMTNNGSTGGTISTKAGSVSIPAGYTSGGSVSIAAAAVTDLVSGNLLSGCTVLVINGSLSVPVVNQDSVTHILSIQ